MERHFSGTAGFHSPFDLFEGEDLHRLSRQLGVGTVTAIPELRWDGGRTRLIPLLAGIRADAKGHGEIFSAIDPDREDLPSRSLEFIQYALGNNIVEVVLRLDDRLAAPVDDLQLHGLDHLALRRDEWDAALAAINLDLRSLNLATIARDRFGDAATIATASERLCARCGEPTALAARILGHAVRNDVDVMVVRDSESTHWTDNLWDVAADSGPPIFHDPALVDGADEWFVRGVVGRLRGRDFADALGRAHQLGSPRAARWLAAAELAPPVATLAPRSTIERLELAIKRSEEALLDSALRDARGAAVPAELRARAHAELVRLRAYPAEARALYDAVRVRDPDQVRAALLAVVAANRIVPADLIGYAVHFMFPTLEQIRSIYPWLQARYRDNPDRSMTCSYNLACVAARFGDKPAMLAWLGAAIAESCAPGDALVDPDFEPYWADPELRALCG